MPAPYTVLAPFRIRTADNEKPIKLKKGDAFDPVVLGVSRWRVRGFLDAGRIAPAEEKAEAAPKKKPPSVPAPAPDATPQPPSDGKE